MVLAESENSTVPKRPTTATIARTPRIHCTTIYLSSSSVLKSVKRFVRAMLIGSHAKRGRRNINLVEGESLVVYAIDEEYKGGDC
jgi:hypothetical protein